jgi:DNA polymerase-3 subunit delta'
MIDLLPWHRIPLRELIARREKLPHALLIHGARGIGKLEFARAIAQSLLCESPEEGIACGQCSACGWFREGNHPDYRELIPEILTDDEGDPDTTVDADTKDKKKSKEIKIEQVRDVADFMTLSTHRDGFRVLLIHPAESMNAAAANALLKTLEEPPARTAILLVSDQLGRLLATIRSRCQRVLLSAPSADEAAAWLAGQGIARPEESLAMAGGAPLDAMQFAAGDYQADRNAFVAVLSAPDADFVAAAQTFEKGDLNHLVGWLQTWVGDLALMKMGGEVRHYVDQRQTLARLASQVDLGRLFRFESELRQARRFITHPLNPRLLLEQLLISYQQVLR